MVGSSASCSPWKRDRRSDNPNTPGDYSFCVPDSVGACPSAMHKGLPSRSGACPERAFGGYSKVRVRLQQPHQSAPQYTYKYHREKSTGRAYERSLSPSSTEYNPGDDRWPSDQRTIGLLCHLDTGRCPWDNVSLGSFLFSFAYWARARRSMAAALSTRLLRRGSCR